MRRRTMDVADGVAGLLVCPGCRGSLKAVRDELVCAGQHRFVATDGIIDLWPPDQPAPRIDPFSSPYGLIYDSAVKERWLARLAGRVGWGTDIDRMYWMMDQGVKCGPGEVVLDVPAGGAPALRSAAGRLGGTYIGVDASRTMLRRAARERQSEGLENVVLVRGDATSLPLGDACVDRILCFNGLHVLADKTAALREFHRVLKPEGQVWGNVVISARTTGDRLSRPWFNRGWLFFHPADPAALQIQARDAGFETWDQEAVGSMLFFKGK